MFTRMGKTIVASLITATLVGGMPAAAAAERLPKPAVHQKARPATGFWGWLSRWLEPAKIVFYEGPRIDPLGVFLNGNPLDGGASALKKLPGKPLILLVVLHGVCGVGMSWKPRAWARLARLCTTRC